jgi:hypothetical protein
MNYVETVLKNGRNFKGEFNEKENKNGERGFMFDKNQILVFFPLNCIGVNKGNKIVVQIDFQKYNFMVSGNYPNDNEEALVEWSLDFNSSSVKELFSQINHFCMEVILNLINEFSYKKFIREIENMISNKISSLQNIFMNNLEEILFIIQNEFDKRINVFSLTEKKYYLDKENLQNREIALELQKKIEEAFQVEIIENNLIELVKIIESYFFHNERLFTIKQEKINFRIKPNINLINEYIINFDNNRIYISNSNTKGNVLKTNSVIVYNRVNKILKLSLPECLDIYFKHHSTLQFKSKNHLFIKNFKNSNFILGTKNKNEEIEGMTIEKGTKFLFLGNYLRGKKTSGIIFPLEKEECIIGEFENNRMKYCKYIFNSSNSKVEMFEGAVNDNKANGKGKITFINKDTIEGEFSNHLKIDNKCNYFSHK